MSCASVRSQNDSNCQPKVCQTGQDEIHLHHGPVLPRIYETSDSTEDVELMI